LFVWNTNQQPTNLVCMEHKATAQQFSLYRTQSNSPPILFVWNTKQQPTNFVCMEHKATAHQFCLYGTKSKSPTI
jgi:hypothetical protein